jgi:hypothetical protein
MELVEFGCIKRVTLPADWTADPELNTSLMTMRSYHPRAQDDVEITFFRKLPGLRAEEIEKFRRFLDLPMHKIAEGSSELVELTPVLGNAGNNQWSNRNRGAAGPNFRFTSGETIFIKDRLVLQVKGSFIDPATKKALNEYCGLFFDSGADKNTIEEAYLQVPSRYGYFQFERYLKVFMDAVFSIQWV